MGNTPSFWTSRSGVVVKRLGLGVAWLAIWGVLLTVCALAAHAYTIPPSASEGFAAVLGLVGVLVFGPVGFLASVLFAKGRNWRFLLGAFLTGMGTVPILLLMDQMPGLVGPGAIVLLLVALWAFRMDKGEKT